MEGMRLSNFYSASPACTASRYALLTGKYPARSGFDWVLYPKSPRGIHPKEITLAESLKQAGYATACYGKWHLGSTKKEYLPLQNGFDEYLGLPYSNDMRPPKWPAIPLMEGNDTIEVEPRSGKVDSAVHQKKHSVY
jgi:arylsulfatase A